jgi:hypothetical protein
MNGSITNQLIKALVALTLVVSAASAFSSETQDIIFTGTALDLKDDTFLYEEIHTLTVDSKGIPLREVVEYRDSNGVTLGVKRMEYTKLYAPDYEVSFEILNLLEQVTATSDQLEIIRSGTKLIPLPDENYSIDGGFHYFIQKNFDQLANGETVDFDFLSAGRGTFIPLSIEPEANDGQELTLKLTLQNFLLSRLVKPIWLTYDLSDRRLLSYEGLTNVPDENKRLYSARIVYQYPQSIAEVSLP